MLYDAIDALPIFRGTVAIVDRSRMNVCWVMEDAALEAEFLAFCKAEGFVGVKGHRSSGGFRASLYNALPYESVVALVEGMRDFAGRKA